MAILRCEALTMRFGGLTAVDNFNFAVAAGEIRGLIGPNGAGKTTIFNMLSGACKPSAGRIIFKGREIAGMKMHAIAALGLVRTFQHSALFAEFTVRDNILIGCHLRRKPGFIKTVIGRRRRAADREVAARAEEILDFFNLSARGGETAGELPHGLQRILGVAVALAADPEMLLLDEPFTGMNPEETAQMMNLTRKIRDTGATILLVEHDMRAVMGLCETITVVNFGRLLAQGRPAQIRRHPEVVAAYLGSAGAIAH